MNSAERHLLERLPVDADSDAIMQGLEWATNNAQVLEAFHRRARSAVDRLDTPDADLKKAATEGERLERALRAAMSSEQS